MFAGHPDRVGRAEPLDLFVIGEFHAERVAAAEVLLHAPPLPSDEHRDLADPRAPQRLDRVREERLAGDREERLREVRGERPHPRPLPRAEDPRLHGVPDTFERASS